MAADHQRINGKPLERTLLLGRLLRDFEGAAEATRVGLEVAEIDDASFAADGDGVRRPVGAAAARARARRWCLLHELLESCGDPGVVLGKLVEALPASTLLVVTYTNTDSLPARMMRRHWPPFFEHKTCFFSTGNLATLHGPLRARAEDAVRAPGHAHRRVRRRLAWSPRTPASRLVNATPLRNLPLPVRAGNRVAVFGRHAPRAKATAREAVDRAARLQRGPLRGAGDRRRSRQAAAASRRRSIIVESNSTDGTRDIVRRYEGRPGVRVVYEEGPRGKGHAVRTGLAHVTGTIVLIQDADFEYDINDYDALLEPILQHKAMFVLGSRSLGLDDWKVRKYDSTPIRGLALNFAQVVFAKTYDALYQQRVTDVNTMYKVFRAECLDGLDLESNGFELDIELACKLARNGNVAHGSAGQLHRARLRRGKEDPLLERRHPSYAAFFKYPLRVVIQTYSSFFGPSL